MDGLAAIGQRIAEIQSKVADPALAVSATSTGTSSGSGFAAALAEALAADAATSVSSGTGTGTTSDALLGYGTTSDALAGYGSSSLYGSGAGSSGMSVASLLSALGLSGSSDVSSLLSSLGLSGTSGLLGVSSVSSATSRGATTGSTALTADGVPAGLAAYGNGHIPASALEPVDGTNASMWAPAAESLERLIAAAKADGITIGVTEGYRSYDEQVSLAKTKGLYSQGGLAAVPGTSEHGWGMAADLKLDSAGLAWMRQHAAEYGFYATAPRESWHWGYKPNG